MIFSIGQSKIFLVIIFILLAIGISITGFIYYKNFERTHRIGVESDLVAISNLKLSEIVQWRKERLGDGSLFLHNANFVIRLKNYLHNPNNSDDKRLLLNWLIKVYSAYQYNRVFLVDIKGKELVSVPDVQEPAITHLAKDIPGILKSGKVTILDFHREWPGGPIFLSVLIPLYDTKDHNRPLGILVLRIDPNKYLYPLIKQWPVPSETAETLLVRKEGNDALFLNELRFKSNTALSLQKSLKMIDMPAVKAVLGHKGIVEGIDYRNVPVIAAVHPVPNTPWFIVARIDKSEVYGPVRERLWVTVILAVALLAGSGGVVGFIWHQQTKSVYKDKYLAAEAIRKSEEKYKLLAEHMSDTVWLMDMNLKTLYCSPSVEKFRGFSPSEIVAMPIEKKLTPKSYEKCMSIFKEEMEKVSSNPKYVFSRTVDLEFYHKNGSIVLSENKFSLIRDENGNPVSIIGEGRDITERKRAEELLKKSEAFLNSIIDQSPYPMWISDETGKLIRINDACCRLLHLKEDEVLGKYNIFKDNIVIEQGLLPFVNDVYEKKKTANFEIVWDSALLDTLTLAHTAKVILDVTIFPILDSSGKLTNAVIQHRDITERKQAEEALKLSEEKFRKAFTTSPDLIAITGIEDGKFLFVNEGFQKSTGYSEEEIRGKTSVGINLWKNPEDRKKYVEQLLTKGEVRDFESILNTKNGEIVGLLSATLIELEGKKHILTIMREITERKRMEEALRESDRRVRAKLDAILLPEGDIGELELADILDVTAIQSLMDDFYKLTKIGIGILDIKGNVLVGTGWQDICTKFHRIHPETNNYCVESDTVLSRGVNPGLYKMYKCKNNIWDISTPIIVGGKHLGNLFLGQFLFDDEPLDKRLFKEQAKQYGFDEKEYLAAYENMPRWNRETVDAVMNFYMKFADMLSKLSYSNIQLGRTLTERDQYMMSLRDSEDRFHRALENIPDVVVIYDKNLRIQYINSATTRITGRSVSDFIGHTEEEIWPPEVYNLYLPELMESKDKKTVKVVDKELTLDDGNSRALKILCVPIMDEKGEVREILGITHDYTEQKLADRALRESEERYRNLVECAPDAIFINLEGRAALVNEACLKLFGAAKEEELLGKSPFELFHHDYHENIRDRIDILHNQGEPVPPKEEKIIRLDGTVVDVEVTAAPFSWGGVNAIHVILRDITERKKAEAELNILYAELEQRVIDRTAQLEAANKELEAFSYSVSHDLRAPLRHMSGFIDLLRKHYEESLPEKGRHYMTNIADSSRQMGILIDDLLDFSRTGRMEMRREQLDMNSIIQDVKNQFEKETVDKKIEWMISLLPPVRGDGSMMKLVWMNLIGNAVKFTRNKKKPKIEIGGENKDGEVVFFVKDNGVGFEMQYANKLFGVFQRLHSSEEFEGTGVGLANVRRIINRHGGRTWAESKLNKGSVFYFSIPIGREQ